MPAIGATDLFAISIWLILVGVLLFIWCEREMRDRGDAVSHRIEATAALALFLLIVGVITGFHAQGVLESSCGSEGLGQPCFMKPGAFSWTA